MRKKKWYTGKVQIPQICT